MGEARSWQRDLGVAILLSAALGAACVIRQHGDLAALRLPDTDDVMRLQQVRDWLSGQAFSDLHQYRLGPPGGTAMHWSRLADMPLALLILMFRPVLGPQAAELIAVCAWPVALAVAYLWIIAGIARRLGGSSVPAMIVAALAYPVSTLFVPGRIDHHGLQIVLLTACVSGIVSPPARWRGTATGAAMIASLAIGFETMPVLVGIALWAASDWLRGESCRMAGFAAGLLVCGIAAGGLIPTSAPAGLCDALSLPLLSIVTISAAALLALVLLAERGLVPRTVALAVATATLAVMMVLLAPAGCRAGPYGAVDPLVAKLWLGHVAEAQPLLSAPPVDAIAYAGLAIVALIATVLRARRDGGAWWGIAGLMTIALATALWQLRGIYSATALAPLALGRAIEAARARGTLRLAGAWIVSTGALYPIAATAAVRSLSGAPDLPEATACDPATTIVLLQRLPPGSVAAPIDMAPAILLGTRHSALAGPYHRDGRGIAGLYAIALGSSTLARTTLRREAVDYVVSCGGHVVGIGALGAVKRDDTRLALHALISQRGITIFKVER